MGSNHFLDIIALRSKIPPNVSSSFLSGDWSKKEQNKEQFEAQTAKKI